MQLADVAEVHLRRAGVDGAVGMARNRGGTQFDPAIAATFGRCAGEILDGLPDDVWRAALAQAPDRDRLLAEGELDGLLEADGRLRRPQVPVHARPFAWGGGPGRRAGRRGGLPEPDVKLLHRAGLVHDLGHMGVSNAIWESRGPLSAGSGSACGCARTDRAHPQPGARPGAGGGAGGRPPRRRRDGSGCRRPLVAGRSRHGAPALAAANVYHAMVEPRPHRGALSEATPPSSYAARRAGVAARRPGRRCGAGGRRAPGTSAQGLAGRTHYRGRGAAPGRPGPVQPRHRRRPVHQREDRPQPRRAHLQQARRLQPDRSQPVRRRARHRRQLPEPGSGKDGAAAPCPDQSLPAASLSAGSGSTDGGDGMRDGQAPRGLAAASIKTPGLPGGTEERFAGYRVMRLPFRSGHYLALRHFRQARSVPASGPCGTRDPPRVDVLRGRAGRGQLRTELRGHLSWRCRARADRRHLDRPPGRFASGFLTCSPGRCTWPRRRPPGC